MIKKIIWTWDLFENLSYYDQYEIHQKRQEVFVVEQNCVYLDADGIDLDAWHLMGWDIERNVKHLAAYLRVTPHKHSYVKIGRVLTAPNYRSKGLGKVLMAHACEKIRDTFGDIKVKMSAQTYLEPFYERFGFCKEGKPYLEDGIPHIMMVRHPEDD